MFTISGILADLRPDTMRRLADQLYRQHVTLIERAAWLEERERRRAELRRHRFPLTTAQLLELRRDARNLAIVRDAWSGLPTRALAARYGLSASRVRAIIRTERERRVRRGADLCQVCRGPVEAMAELASTAGVDAALSTWPSWPSRHGRRARSGSPS
jgi:hypothetical protein